MRCRAGRGNVEFLAGERIRCAPAPGEVVEEGRTDALKHRMPAQKVDFVTGKAEVKQMIDGLLESRSQQERTVFGKPANAQLERCCLIRFSVSEIGCRHGQLVKIRE